MSWRGVISVVLLLGGAAGLQWVVRNPRLQRLMEAAEAAEDSQEAEKWLLKAMEELREPDGFYLNWSTHRKLEPVVCARLASLYEQRPDPALAEQWHLRAVSYYEEKEDRDGLRYTTIAVPLSALAAFYEKQGRLAEADRTYSQAVTAYVRQGKILGDGGYISATNVVDCLYRYARLLVRLHRPDEAAAMRKQAGEIKTRLGKDFPYWPEE
jgi:tetratricopeptide (TPR) repeat protein